MDFDIVTEGGDLTVPQNGTETVTYTVTSGLGAEIEARLAVATDGAPTDWFTVEGESPVKFAPDETRQVRVTIAPPADAEPGRYPFRLRVGQDDQPEAAWVSGPQRAVTVVEQATPPWPWLILAVLVLLVIGGALIWCFTAGPCAGESCDVAVGEACSEELCCAEGMVCTDEGICRGEVGFAGCSDGAEHCVDGFCADKTCAAAPTIGAACVEERCGPGLACTGGRCLGEAGAADCTADGDCATGWCQTEPDPNVCSSPPAAGEPCAGDRCAQGLSCPSGTCVAPNGHTCDDDAQCASTACIGGTCRALPGLSARCLEGRCDAGLDCNGTYCLVAQNGACSNPSECITGHCQGGRCTPEPGVNQPCSGPCGGQLVCVGGRCKIADGQPCGASAHCQSGYCDGTCKPKVPVGAACNTPSDCNRGQQCAVDLRNGRKTCRLANRQSCRTNDQCASLNCIGGKCGSKSNLTCRNQRECGAHEDCVSLAGTDQKACLRADGVACTRDGQCGSLWCSDGKCRANSGICADDRGCPHGFRCTDGTCRLPRGARCITSANLCNPRADICRPSGSRTTCQPLRLPNPALRPCLGCSAPRICVEGRRCVDRREWVRTWATRYAAYVMRVRPEILDRLLMERVAPRLPIGRHR